MRLLVLADSFSVDGQNPWLIEDLAGALVQDHHHVDVVVNDRVVPRRPGLQPAHPTGARVLSIGCTSAPKSVWHRRGRLVSSMARYRSRVLDIVAGNRYDGVIFSSLAFTNVRTAQYLVHRGVARRSLLIQWDFFPRHHAEIGGRFAPQRLFFWPLYGLERWAVSGADAVAVMSELNREFFQQYFRITPRTTVVQPPWGVDLAQAEGAVRDEPDGPTVAVFGGQLTAGRGLSDILLAADLLQRAEAPIAIRIYGDGPSRARLVADSQELGLQNTQFCGRVSRSEYLQSLHAAHCGIAATVANVTIPSFPSKIVDYAAAGVPIVVSAEASSDVGEVVSRRGAGWSCSAGDPRALADTLMAVDRSRSQGEWIGTSASARRWYETELSARAAARSLSRALGEEPLSSRST